jgi:iron complex outermembrane receptor protein
MAVAVLPAYAQQPAAEKLVLEEVLVSARKREESLQDVSVAVSAVAGSAIDDAHIRDSAELSKLVPSLTVGSTSSGGTGSFVIRGVGTLVFSDGAEPSVSTMIDGVVLGRASQSFMQLVDIERVEVLRGPQGTLFGKNSTGGVVHFLTRNPSDEFEAEVSATAVDYDEYRFGGSISGPITETFGARLTYGGVRDDGYIKNVYDGSYYNGGDTDTARLKLRWQPTFNLDLKWSSDFNSEQDGTNQRTARIVIDPVVAATLLPVVASEDNYEVNLDGEIFLDQDSSGHALTVDWDIGDYSITSITAYRENSRESMNDNDGLPTNPVSFTQRSDNEQEQFSQELRVTSPGDGRLRYVAGLFAFLQTQDSELARTFATGGNVASSSTDNTNYAAFGELTYDINEALRVIVGGRYTYDEIEYDFVRTGNVFPPIAAFSEKADDDDFSGKLVLEWDASEDVMVYGSYAEGYKGQAFNVTFGSSSGDPVPPETSQAWEIGAKSTLMEGRVRLNAALFRTDYEDFQAQVFIEDDNNTAFALASAGDTRTQGLELDITGRVTENLTLFGGLALIDATIEDFENGPCSNGQRYRGVGYKGQESCGIVPSSLANQDLSGGELPFSPDWKISLNANYAIPLNSVPFGLVIKGSYQGQGEFVSDISQDKFTVQDGYNIFDLALTVDADDGSWDATVFVKNVTDKNYAGTIISDIPQFNNGGYSQILPKHSRRTAGVELRYFWF